MKPTKKVFDLVLSTSILLHPALGLIKMSSLRWSRESTGAVSTIGDAVGVIL